VQEEAVKYFISDLHIGDQSSWDCFGNKKAESLIRLLERIDRHMNHSGELILLGDIFDLTLLAGDASLPMKIDSAEIFSRVRKAYPRLFVAFREFIRAGNSLFYVWGNHDYLMRFKKHAHQFYKAVLRRWWDSFQQRRIWFSDYYISPSHSLYAEHGHRYDVTNVHINGGYMTLGSLMAAKFIKKWQPWKSDREIEGSGLEEGSQPFQILGNIRPWPNIIYYIDRLIDQGVLPDAVKKELARDLYHIREEAKSSVPHIFFRILESMPWFIQEGFVSSRLKDEAPRSLREKAKLLLKGYSTDLSVAGRRATVGSRKDLNFAPKMVVFGHTHFMEHVLEEGKYVYANTGSWQDTVFVDREGRIMKIQDICPYLEVFPPGEDGLPKAVHRRALDASEIDLNELSKDYKEFGLTFV
jgi:UDP-2,3-diacylglucosamine pyrophosphatase LpxH